MQVLPSKYEQLWLTAATMHAASDHPESPVRYVRFPQLLAGRGGTDFHAVLGSLTDPLDFKVRASLAGALPRF